MEPHCTASLINTTVYTFIQLPTLTDTVHLNKRLLPEETPTCLTFSLNVSLSVSHESSLVNCAGPHTPTRGWPVNHNLNSAGGSPGSGGGGESLGEKETERDRQVGRNDEL